MNKFLAFFLSSTLSIWATDINHSASSLSQELTIQENSTLEQMQPEEQETPNNDNPLEDKRPYYIVKKKLFIVDINENSAQELLKTLKDIQSFTTISFSCQLTPQVVEILKPILSKVSSILYYSAYAWDEENNQKIQAMFQEMGFIPSPSWCGATIDGAWSRYDKAS